MTTTYEDDDRMLTRIMTEATPRNVSRRTFDKRLDSTGSWFASVNQHTYTDAGMQAQQLDCRWFATERGADRWLNTKREG